MTRWLYWTPLVLLTAGVGVMGLRLGWADATRSDTDMINVIAARYAVETGGLASDCHATPGPEGAWLTVYCEGAAGRFAYPVDARGRAVKLEAPGT